jgi:CheY-like chemotaxis protein
MEVKGVQGVKILVGDDDRVNQLVIRGMLKKLGHECHVVGTGREVVEAVASQPFDLIFLDIQLPDIDGFEVVREVKKIPNLATQPRIAFVSGHDASDFRVELAELGVNHFLTKPITVDALARVLPSE